LSRLRDGGGGFAGRFRGCVRQLSPRPEVAGYRCNWAGPEAAPPEKSLFHNPYNSY
jgi:hypothetical protein